jgi:NitT/TauT family transport system substrate-binding protein
MAEQQTEQIDRKVLWASLYGDNPKNAGGGEVKVQLDYIINERVQRLLAEATEFLNGLPNKPAAAPRVRESGVDDKIAREVLEKRNLKSPVSIIKAQPLSEFK